MENQYKRVLLTEHLMELLNAAGTEPEETLHMGIAAIVRLVNTGTGLVTVMDPEGKKEERFGENCMLDCRDAEKDGFNRKHNATYII